MQYLKKWKKWFLCEGFNLNYLLRILFCVYYLIIIIYLLLMTNLVSPFSDILANTCESLTVLDKNCFLLVVGMSFFQRIIPIIFSSLMYKKILIFLLTFIHLNALHKLWLSSQESNPCSCLQYLHKLKRNYRINESLF